MEMDEGPIERREYNPINRIKSALESVFDEALAVLEFREKVYYEPYTKEWKTTLSKGTAIKTDFGGVKLLELRSNDGVVKCRHPEGLVYLNGELIALDGNGRPYIVENSIVCTDKVETKFDLDGNEIVNDPLQRFRCTSVDLRGNFVDDQSIEKVSQALIGNHIVTQLYLSGNAIKDAGAELLAKGLEKNACLQELYLSYNEIGPLGSQALALMMIHNSGITALDLSHNKLGSSGLSAWFGAALKSNKTLKTLKLSHNSIGDEGAAEIFESLVHVDPNAAKNMWMTSQKTDKAKTFNTTLECLLLCDIDMTLATASQVGSVLESNHNIHTLDLSSNKFEDEGVTIVAKGLKDNVGLEVLNFDHNRVSEKAAQQLCDALVSHKTLRKATFYGCFSGSETASSFATVLSQNSTLQELDLCDCPFEAPGIVELCTSIGKNTGLQVLELTSAGLQADSTIKVLTKALRNNTSLTLLNLGYNNITLRGCKWLNDAIFDSGGPCKLSEDTLILQGNSGHKDEKGVIVKGGLVCASE